MKFSLDQLGATELPVYISELDIEKRKREKKESQGTGTKYFKY